MQTPNRRAERNADMLSAWILAASLATAQIASQAQEQLPQLPDHRTQFSVSPPVMTLTANWSCGKSAKVSEAKIRVTETPYVNEGGERIYNSRFKVELVELVIGGRKAPDTTFQKARDRVRHFNTITVFEGRCFQSQPALNIIGFEWDRDSHKKKRVEIEL